MKYTGIVVLLVGLLAVVGCSSPVVEDQAMPVPTEDGTQPSVEETIVEEETVTAPTAGEVNQVVIENFKYSPFTMEVNVGDTVEWVNKDSAAHTVTMSTLNVDENLPQGATFTYTFTEKGTYEYRCRFHAGMKGKVIVS